MENKEIFDGLYDIKNWKCNGDAKMHAIITNAIKLLESMQWISVKDRLPDYNGTFLVVSAHDSISIKSYALDLNDVDEYDFPEHESGWYNYDSEYGYYKWSDVLYWMPLPLLPPKEEFFE